VRAPQRAPPPLPAAWDSSSRRRRPWRWPGAILAWGSHGPPGSPRGPQGPPCGPPGAPGGPKTTPKQLQNNYRTTKKHMLFGLFLASRLSKRWESLGNLLLETPVGGRTTTKHMLFWLFWYLFGSCLGVVLGPPGAQGGPGRAEARPGLGPGPPQASVGLGRGPGVIGMVSPRKCYQDSPSAAESVRDVHHATATHRCPTRARPLRAFKSIARAWVPCTCFLGAVHRRARVAGTGSHPPA